MCRIGHRPGVTHTHGAPESITALHCYHTLPARRAAGPDSDHLVDQVTSLAQYCAVTALVHQI